MQDKPYNIEHCYGQDDHKLEIECVYLRSYSGEETHYEITLTFDDENRIVDVEPLHAKKYCYSDATREGYKAVRAGDFDYLYNVG